MINWEDSEYRQYKRITRTDKIRQWLIMILVIAACAFAFFTVTCENVSNESNSSSQVTY